MYSYFPFSFHFSCNHDVLKKMKLEKSLNFKKNKLSLLTLKDKKIKLTLQASNFWVVELISLQKAFSQYKKKKIRRKHFYFSKGYETILKKDKMFYFLYHFLKINVFNIPYLNYYFVVETVRNLKIETNLIFYFIQKNKKIFNNIKDLFITSKKFKFNFWFSLYKIITI